MTIEEPACANVEDGPRSLQFRLPAGAIIQTVPPVGALGKPDAFLLASSGLGQVSAAMAPLAPIFTLVEAALAIKKFAEAVASNPFSVTDAMGDVLRTADKLASVVPQLSVPILARDLVAALDMMLLGIQQQIDALLAQQTRVEAARAMVGDVPSLVGAVTCADEQLAGMCANLDASLGLARGVIDLLTLLMAPTGLAGPPALGAISSNPGELTISRDAIAEMRQFLAFFLSTLPV